MSDPIPPQASPALAADPAAEAVHALTPRVTELEIKLSFADDLLDQLNQTVFRQQRLIEHLLREVAELRRQSPDDGGAARTLRDDIPPHY